MWRRISVLSIIYMIIWVDITICYKALPDRMHCLTRLSYSDETHTILENLRVEEYLDIEARKSSVSIHNAQNGSTEIHYNKLSTDTLGGRKLVTFDPSSMSCKSQMMGEWQFAELRRVAIYFYRIHELDGLYLDVPIGPSVLLFAVGANTNKFEFVKTIYSPTLVSNVNVYTSLHHQSINSMFQPIKMVLHVSTLGQLRYLEPGDTLEKALLPSSHLEVKFLGACQVRKSKQLFPSSSGSSSEEAEKSLEGDGNWEEHNFCSAADSGEKLLFQIHYDIVEEYGVGSLVGRQLDEFELENYDFAQEPFMQPVGIGCWSQGSSQSLRESLINLPSGGHISLSGSYVTSIGLKGLSFVAYDGTRHLLRLDREGRKSIYDLNRSKSYHSGEYSSSNDFDNPIESQLAVEKCIVLDIDHQTSSIDNGKDILDQLLGLSSNEAHYLGTQTIEHEQFEVYELAVSSRDRVPLLLRAKLGQSTDKKISSFVTYYIQAPNLIRFIELYDYEAAHRQRKLINRLEFVDFSWSLEVEPPDDPQSQASAADLRLFEMEACLQSRATQASLTVALERDAEVGQIDANQLTKALMANKQELIGSVQRFLADSLQISSLNIVDLKMDVSSSQQHLIVTNKIVDLRLSRSRSAFLGSTRYFDYTLHGFIVHYYHRRHSLEECFLDSVEYPKANWVAYCPQLASCAILVCDGRLGSKLDHSISSETDDDDSKPTAGRRDECHVYAFLYSTIDKTLRSSSALDQVDTNQRYLDGKRFEFEIKSYTDVDTGQLEWGHLFGAQVRVLNYKPLDTIGARLLNNLATISGLRYSTMEEESLAQNSNQRVQMEASITAEKLSKSATFSHCQLSCQLDEFCGSFSVCFRKSNLFGTSNPPEDCVLSTLRLTEDRVGKFVAGASQVQSYEKRFQVNQTSEFGSQDFVMYKDEACSLHPRDFVTDYKVIRSFERVNHETQSSYEKHLTRNERRMTLEECASLSFEKTFGCQFIHQTNFTYCPMESNCMVNGDDSGQLDQHSSSCMIYERHPSGAYLDMRSTHMSVTLPGKTGNKALVSTQDASGLIDQITAEPGSTGPIRTFIGLSEEDCARECSFHKSECLAFDSCRNLGKTLCLLYPIRSPLAKRSAHLPLLKREQEIFHGGEVKLVSSSICDHFHLRPGYFEVRLKSLLARQGNDSDGTKLPADLEKLEDRIEATYDKLGKQELMSMEEILKRETNPPLVSSFSSGFIHWFELVLGLMIGCVVISYKQQVFQAISVVYFRMRHSRNNADEHRLVMDDQL